MENNNASFPLLLFLKLLFNYLFTAQLVPFQLDFDFVSDLLILLPLVRFSIFSVVLLNSLKMKIIEERFY